MAAPERLRVGLVGTGKHGTRYARHIRDDFPELALTALSRRDEERLGAAVAEFGGEPYTDYRELFASGAVDAVVAVVPPTLHRDIVACAARHGVPLLIEKPAAPSLREGAEMLEMLRARPVPVMVAQTLRYNAVVRVLRRRLSEVSHVHAVNLSQRFEPSPLAWLDDPSVSGGGMTLHTGVHLFDLLRLFTGRDPESVTCQMQRVHTKHTEDSFAATLEIAEPPALATVSCARTAGGRGGHIELAGERGTLIADHVLHQATRVVGTRREEIAIGPPVPTVREVIRDFTSAVREGSPMPIPLTEGLRAVAVVDACYAAARTGARVRVDLDLLS